MRICLPELSAVFQLFLCWQIQRTIHIAFRDAPGIIEPGTTWEAIFMMVFEWTVWHWAFPGIDMAPWKSADSQGRTTALTMCGLETTTETDWWHCHVPHLFMCSNHVTMHGAVSTCKTVTQKLLSVTLYIGFISLPEGALIFVSVQFMS